MEPSTHQSSDESMNLWPTVETPRLVDLPTGALKPLLSGNGVTSGEWIVTLAPTSCVNIPTYSSCSTNSVSLNPGDKVQRWVWMAHALWTHWGMDEKLVKYQYWRLISLTVDGAITMCEQGSTVPHSRVEGIAIPIRVTVHLREI